MTKNRNARKNSKRKTSPCNPKGDEQLLRFALSSGQSIEIRSSEKLQATRLCGESPDHPDFTLCDLIFDATSSRICLPRELWDNELVESVSSSLLHLLFGVQDATSDASERNPPTPREALHAVPWLISGRHAILLPEDGRPCLVADLSTDGDHSDHNGALSLQEAVPLKKCRLPRFAVHQTMATLTLVFYVQNFDRNSLAVTFCNCNSLLRIEFCLDSEFHTTYRVVLGHPSLENALMFPQSVRAEVHRDSAFILYIDKAEGEHVLWTEMLICDTCTTHPARSMSEGSSGDSEIARPTLERRFSAPCEPLSLCPPSPDRVLGRGILKNRRLCSRTLSECSRSLEFSSWDISESLRSSSTSTMHIDDVKRVTFNNKVLETKYRPEGISIKRRTQRTRSLSDSSDPDESEETDSICGDLREGLTLRTSVIAQSKERGHALHVKEDQFLLEMDDK
ncbi:uncharacterized protein LOC111266923 isoform X2 [Varroa jacobsoni]|uniref:Uncharacterized protein n=1 Tax=Varroa destructor TaxID=109461 RepID=A0A7M7KVL4_VARDE|nr:uncharacterized protein LOC111254672 isoform X2 [Varroa destructor]XP_022700511.1 uncharacterized protein LOC111266923 isoform X2 [Varroa jacobsoni]